MRTATIALLAAAFGLGSGLTASALFEHQTTTTRTVTITYHDSASTGHHPTPATSPTAASSAPTR